MLREREARGAALASPVLALHLAPPADLCCSGQSSLCETGSCVMVCLSPPRQGRGTRLGGQGWGCLAQPSPAFGPSLRHLLLQEASLSPWRGPVPPLGSIPALPPPGCHYPCHVFPPHPTGSQHTPTGLLEALRIQQWTHQTKLPSRGWHPSRAAPSLEGGSCEWQGPGLCRGPGPGQGPSEPVAQVGRWTETPCPSCSPISQLPKDLTAPTRSTAPAPRAGLPAAHHTRGHSRAGHPLPHWVEHLLGSHPERSQGGRAPQTSPNRTGWFGLRRGEGQDRAVLASQGN